MLQFFKKSVTRGSEWGWSGHFLRLISHSLKAYATGTLLDGLIKNTTSKTTKSKIAVARKVESAKLNYNRECTQTRVQESRYYTTITTGRHW